MVVMVDMVVLVVTLVKVVTVVSLDKEAMVVMVQVPSQLLDSICGFT
jgi:hypothetical protein